MLFEAGFLARSADTLICPYLFDVTPGDLPEPLERFQTTMANRNDTERLVLAVNAKAAEATSDRCGASGATCFEDLWPLLERDLRCIDVSNGLKAIQLGQLIDSSATPMYITDERLVLRQCNEPMMSLLRATRRRLIGKTVEEVVEMLAALLIEGEEFRSRQLAMLARARSGLLPDAFFSMDVTLRDLDGSRYVGLHHLYIHADALTSSEESRPLGSFVILHLEKK
jgi:PAS domain-containing protein